MIKNRGILLRGGPRGGTARGHRQKGRESKVIKYSKGEGEWTQIKYYRRTPGSMCMLLVT